MVVVRAGRTLTDEDDEAYTSSDDDEEVQEAKAGAGSRPLIPFIRQPSFCGFYWKVYIINIHVAAVYTWRRCTRCGGVHVAAVYTWRRCTRGGGVYSQVRRRSGERLAIDE